MSSSWAEASKCPRDGSQGAIASERAGTGQLRGSKLITLICPETRCGFHEDGWVVQIRPDNTIPDPQAPRTREKQFYFGANERIKARRIREQLDAQVERETQAGTEVKK